MRVGVVTLCASIAAGAVRGDETAAKAILEKGIKALGGEEKLTKAQTFSTKSKGTVTFNNEDHDFTAQSTGAGLDLYRSEFEMQFDGNDMKALTVLSGEKGWRRFGELNELSPDEFANEKRNFHLVVIPATLVPLKGKGYKLDTAGEVKIGDKDAVAIKVTEPDGKDFKLFFEKESGLPVRLEARVVGFDNAEFDQQTTYSNYKDFGGLKKATKLESKRNGEKFISQEITDYKTLEKASPDAFAEPK
jgi:hypothetical protein